MLRKKSLRLASALAGAVLLCSLSTVFARADEATARDSLAQQKKIVAAGVDYLRNTGQADDGSFSGYAGIGPTALITTALLQNGVASDDPMVAKSLSYVKKYVQDDGGIYNPEGMFRNYETCLAITCFAAANRDGKYDDLLKNAEMFIKEMQWDETEGKSVDDTYYGGAGYGSHERPDMSNTTFFVDALKASGAGPDDPAMKKALLFISRCQNLESPHNTTEFAAKINDGGFYYTCAAGGETKVEGEPGVTDVETMPNGGLASYGSMTYAGLKSMIYAGVTADDPRVKAATEWLARHYDLQQNPGVGAQGLFYYYQVLGKALDAVGKEQFKDAQGVEHDWRAELVETLAKHQQPDGSWINTDSTRWLEGDPNLVTGYALLALSYCGEEK